MSSTRKLHHFSALKRLYYYFSEVLKLPLPLRFSFISFIFLIVLSRALSSLFRAVLKRLVKFRSQNNRWGHFIL